MRLGGADALSAKGDIRAFHSGPVRRDAVIVDYPPLGLQAAG
jgi:hypothetical protein